MSGLIIPTYLRTFTFWSWEAANPRTTMPFSNNLFLGHAISHGFRNLSRWERFGFVEREVSASNSLRLTLVNFLIFLGSFHRPIPVRCNWSVLHVRKFHIRIRKDCSEQVCDLCWIRHGGMNPSGNTFLGRRVDPRSDL